MEPGVKSRQSRSRAHAPDCYILEGATCSRKGNEGAYTSKMIFLSICLPFCYNFTLQRLCSPTLFLHVTSALQGLLSRPNMCVTSQPGPSLILPLHQHHSLTAPSTSKG